MCKAVTAQTGNNPHAHSQYKCSMNRGTFTHHIAIGKNNHCHIQQDGGPSQTERWVKPARVKRACTVRRHYMKFRNKQNEPVLLEIRPLAALGNGTDWEGREGAFWGVGEDLHLNWSSGYTWVSICKSLLSFIRYICAYCQWKQTNKKTHLSLDDCKLKSTGVFWEKETSLCCLFVLWAFEAGSI